MDAAGGNPAANLRKRPLSVRTSREAADRKNGAAAAEPEGEPVSPIARLMEDFYIVVVIGVGTPINMAAARAGVESQLARYPHFTSVQVTDQFEGGKTRWVRTTVNLDDHVVIPALDPTAVATNPDQVVEDYVSSLSTLPMDHSRPLWEFHVLDFPTSEATATTVIRVHHSLGDGTSLLALLMACTRSAADPTALPAMPPPPKRTGPIYARPRPPPSAGAMAFAMWIFSYFLLAWHTVVDIAYFLATIWFVSDPNTLFKRAGERKVDRKRFLHRTLSLDDVKFVKNTMNCTVNDVLIGVTSSALSRYYFRHSGESDTKKNICLRSVLLVNIRPTPGLNTFVKTIEGEDDDVKWGNRLGYILLPFHIAMHNDPLEYVRKAKKTVDRKKNSMEVIFTHLTAEMAFRIFGINAAAAIFHRMITHTTISFSNMIGPIERVEFCGHPVVFMAPSAYGPPEALSINFQSYMNTIKLILAIDDEHFPDSHQLLDDFAESLRLIKDAIPVSL